MLILLYLLLWVADPISGAVLLAQLQTKPVVDSVWPVSIVTWLTSISTFILIIDRVKQARKDDRAPIYKAIEDAKVELQDDIKRVEENFAREVGIQRREVDRDINGLGSRLAEVDKTAELALDGTFKIGERMLRSEIDRAALHDEIGRLRGDVEANAKLMYKSEMVTRKRVLNAISDIAKAIAASKSAPQTK